MSDNKFTSRERWCFLTWIFLLDRGLRMDGDLALDPVSSEVVKV